jgi:8-oxo-dGTP diphosphatase
MINEEVIRKQAKLDSITHISTGVAVVKDGKVLVVRRVAHDDTLAGEWELPGGGVDSGETIEQGAVRELHEETGLKVDKILGTFEGFDYTTPKKPKVRQINFKVSVKPGDIRLSEHDMYKWITADDIPGLKTNSIMQDCLCRAFA